MATAKQDYMGFLRWLHALQPAAPENVRRFANMVLADFERIAETAPQRNARSSYLAELAHQALATTPLDLPASQDQPQQTQWPWTRLRALTLGPFRGFVREETFDLQKGTILVYGPNGAGKSSLCEALERALLGSVEEAGLKRLGEADYFRNIHAREFSEPRLLATTPDRREVPVVANVDLFRFCFIEKNRIDAFSRIAQRTAGQRAELIATLFGMERFSDFCNRFNESIAPALVTERAKQRELNLKKEALARDQATVAGEAEALARHDAEDEAYAQAFSPHSTYADLQAWIGSAQAPSRLAELESLLDAVPATPLGVDRAALGTCLEQADVAGQMVGATTRELERRASQVSFKALYGAIVELQVVADDRCPACNTPLDQTARNPFEAARAGLDELRELADLQERAAREHEDLTDASTGLRSMFFKLAAFLADRGDAAHPIARFVEALPARPATDVWWKAVYAPPREGGEEASLVDQMLALADEIALSDETIRRQLEQRAALIGERNDLVDRQNHIGRRQGVRQAIVDGAATARQHIDAFNAANERLIADAEQEALDIVRDAPIRTAYDGFLPLLRRYRNELPGLLVVGLGDLARDLYNEFNRHDQEGDKLSSLYLPSTGEQRIELAFRGAADHRVDALQVLSEGHIRCLGLAILLAKAIDIGSPVLIFDDAVNAIDDEHRDGIKQTMFVDDRFAATQILVTCHSPEFIKDVKNSLPRDRRRDSQEYVLTQHEGDHHPRVHRDIPSSAYIEKARRDLERFQLRDALGNSRRALEMLANKAWKWLGSHDQGELRLALDGPGRPPILRDVCDSLRVKLAGTPNFQHPSKQPLHDALTEVLAASNPTWNILNKGTHEEENREEFDRVQVELVISRLERIDALELRGGR